MVFVTLIYFAIAAAALFVLRHRKVGEERCYKIPGYPVLPVIYLLAPVALEVVRAWYQPVASLTDLAFLATGLPFAVYFIRRRIKQSKSDPV